jgi:hypothetical protein
MVYHFAKHCIFKKQANERFNLLFQKKSDEEIIQDLNLLSQ